MSPIPWSGLTPALAVCNRMWRPKHKTWTIRIRKPAAVQSPLPFGEPVDRRPTIKGLWVAHQGREVNSQGQLEPLRGDAS